MTSATVWPMTASARASAEALPFTVSAPNTWGWDYTAQVTKYNYDFEPNYYYSFEAKAGSTYDIWSWSYNDPTSLRIYDATGEVAIVNDDENDGAPLLIGGISYSVDAIWDWVAPHSGTYYVDASWRQSMTTPLASLVIRVNVDTAVQPGIPANQSITGTTRADFLTGGAGNDTIDGAAGIDTVVYSGPRSGFAVTRSANGQATVNGGTGDGRDTLINVERIKFGDATLALDIDGNAGQAYRVYQAAFNRTPDAAGLGYWISAMDAGSSLNDVARGFVNSAEFRQAYGVSPDNDDFVATLYQNILHRAPEAAGLQYWAGILDRNAATQADVLAAISESAENKAGLVDIIGNGFVYLPYGG